MKRKWLLRLFALIGVVLLCLFVFLGTRNYYTEKMREEKEEKQKPEPTPVTVNDDNGKWLKKAIVLTGETVAAGLKDIGKLCTAEYYFTHVETFESKKELWGYTIPGTTSSYIYSYDGRILAGVDFTKVAVDVDGERKTVTVTLPAVELITSEIDEDSFTLYGEKTGLFNPFEVEDFALSLSDMIKSEEKKAVETGLLDRAAENAETILRNFLAGSMELEEFNIVIHVGNSV